MADSESVDDDKGGVFAVTTSSDLTEEEWKAVEEFILIIESESVFDEGQPVDEEAAIKFLMARKFDVNAAVSTFRNNQITYKKFNIMDMKPFEDPLKKELLSGKFTVLKGKDRSGAVVCMFTANLHNPKFDTHCTVLQSLIFQLDEVMRSLQAQRNGLTLIYDMAGAGYTNFDFDLSMKVLSLLKGGYPARLKHVYIIAAPLWFRASLVVLSTFLKEKIRDRVEVFKSGEDLLKHLPVETVPSHLGGSATVDHLAWLSQCIETFQRVNDMSTSRNSRKRSERLDTDTVTEVATHIEKLVTPDISDNEAVSDSSSKGIDSISNHSSKSDITDAVPDDLDLSSKATVTNESTVTDTQIEDKIEENFEGDTDSLGPDSLYRNNGRVPTVIVTDTSVESTPSKGSVSKKTSDELPSEANTTQEEPMSTDLEGDFDDHEEDDVAFSFDEFIEHMKATGREGLHLEYRELRAMPPIGQFTSTRHPVNVIKNRYSDVLCFEHSRVKLSHVNDDKFSDYINANYVDGYKQPRAYICTQGPMNNTYGDFWRMVWEQNTRVVVMITRCVERGRVKCGKYWPDDNKSTLYGRLHVTSLNTEVNDDYTVRNFHLHHVEENKEHFVTHFQFTSWPDFGVLASPQPFHEVLEQVRLAQAAGYEELQNEIKLNESKETVTEPPVIVHCSAGIGRTGTFCCTDINMRMMTDRGKIDIFDTVRRLREQRAFSVQTPGQYEFCHIAVISHMIQLRQEQGLQTEDLEQFLVEWDSTNQTNP